MLACNYWESVMKGRREATSDQRRHKPKRQRSKEKNCGDNRTALSH
jgi:hypothetical protein